MMYEEVIRDFAIRTRKNLEVIESLHQEGKEVYEATQLVNSTLGLLIFPRQKFIDKMPPKSIYELEKEGWPIPKVSEGFKQVENLNKLISYLRHAIAHGHIEFLGDGQNELRLLRVWNIIPRNNIKDWEAELSLNDLKGLTERFIDLLTRTM